MKRGSWFPAVILRRAPSRRRICSCPQISPIPQISVLNLRNPRNLWMSFIACLEVSGVDAAEQERIARGILNKSLSQE